MTSYAEKTEDMKIKDPERRSPERTEVYIEARKQSKTGQLHPNVVEDIQKLNELKSSQDSASYTSLDNDALTQAFGKDKKGRTRGIGPVSKSKVKVVTPIRSEMQNMEKNVMNEISKKFEEVNSNMQLNMQLILKAVSSTGQVFSPP